MSRQRRLNALLEDWRRSGVPLEEPSETEGRSERLVPEIARSIAQQAALRVRTERRRNAVYALAAAAALAIGVGTWTRSPSPRAQPIAVVEGALGGAPAREVALEDEITSAAAQLRVRFVTGALVELEPKSSIALSAAAPGSQIVRLSTGEISVVVPKLAPPAEFAVHTSDARVVVHGTRFVVSIGEAASNGARTRVRVSEGVVSVHYRGTEARVSAGQSWPPPTTSKAAAPPAEAPRDAAPPKAERSTQTRARSPSAGSHAEPPPTIAALAEQNRLFSSARAASRRGDDRGAVALLDQLVREHPKSPLLPEARVERFRALKRLGDERGAAREAKQYLLEQKDGYARDEARELILPSKNP